MSAPFAVRILDGEEPVCGALSRVEEALLTGCAEERGPAENYLPGVEDDGVVVEANAAADPSCRELYFKLPSNLGPLKIPGVEPGCLLKLNKSIYGTNDAARQWYLALVDILKECC